MPLWLFRWAQNVGIKPAPFFILALLCVALLHRGARQCKAMGNGALGVPGLDGNAAAQVCACGLGCGVNVGCWRLGGGAHALVPISIGFPENRPANGCA